MFRQRISPICVWEVRADLFPCSHKIIGCCVYVGCDLQKRSSEDSNSYLTTEPLYLVLRSWTLSCALIICECTLFNEFHTTFTKVLYFPIYILIHLPQFLKHGRCSVNILCIELHCCSFWSSRKEEITQFSKSLQFQTWSLVVWGMCFIFVSHQNQNSSVKEIKFNRAVTGFPHYLSLPLFHFKKWFTFVKLYIEMNIKFMELEVQDSY